MSFVSDSHDPKSPGDLTPPATAPEPAAAPLPAQTAVTDIREPRALVYTIGAALVAGLLAWGIGEQTYGYYRPSAASQSGRDFRALNREEGTSDQKNSAIAFGTFGALLGLLFGAAGGALRRSIPSGAGAALAGLMLGGIGGVMMSYALAPIFRRLLSDESPSLVGSFLVRGGIWGVVGMMAGLALGWGWKGTRGIPGALVGGLAGSICGTIAFEVVNAVLFPADRNDAVIPSSTQTRLLAFLFVSVGAAIGAVLVGRHQSAPERPTAEPRLT
jgi:hypothetical protein